jgi:uncharacterized protein (TIGR03437 family)
MIQTLFRRIAIAVLAFAFPTVALAQLNQTTTLQSNTSLNLDTGATAGSAGDILWNGSSIAPQGKATAVVIYPSWPVEFFDTISSILVALTPGYSNAPIPAADLGVEVVFGVHTNGGHYAKVIVLANSGGAITLQFTTFGVPAGNGGGNNGPPKITSIRNNSSFIGPGLPNSGIAPSSIFVVIGTGLADPGTPVLQSSAAPGIPLTLNGASISVVVNGTAIQPALYYTSPTQLAAVLPAGTPVGNGTLTVTYKGVASNAASIQVVPTALGINIYNTNTAVATDAVSGALLTYLNSGTPGQTITLWTTGLGSDPADSDTTYTLTPHALNTPLQIYVGGIAATILYQGSAGYPGVNQINLTIPPGAPDGCFISLAAVAGGVVSNIATLPINRGGGACTDAVSGLSGNQLAGSIQTIRTGLVSLIQTDTPDKSGARTITNSTDAAFEKYTGIYTPSNLVSPGGCIVNDLTPNNPADTTGLDPGTIKLTGPSNLSVTLASQFGIKGAFFAGLAAGAIPSTGGTFIFTGSGGADVGSFTSTITLSNPLLTWINQSAAATVDRTQGLMVTWSGGNPGTYLFITGTSSAPPTGGALQGALAGFTCLAAVNDGQFVVPSYILSALPAGKGGIEVQNDVYGTLSASGLDIGVAVGVISVTAKSTYQ